MSAIRVAMPNAFDSAAASYDTDFSNTRIGRWMRGAIWDQFGQLFRAGEHILDLGCGTGEDAIWLARHGMHVTACDASLAMLEIAAHKAAIAGVADCITWVHIDLSNLPKSIGQFDGAISNFGALNCIADRKPLAAWLTQQLAPQAKLALVLIGPFCLWEIGWHVAHGDLRAATRRWWSGRVVHVGEGAVLPVWYPTPGKLRNEFTNGYRHIKTHAIGGLLPPPYLEPIVSYTPQFFQTLALLERRIGQQAPLPWIADHYLSIFERI